MLTLPNPFSIYRDRRRGWRGALSKRNQDMTTIDKTETTAETTAAQAAKFKIEMALFLISCHRLDEAAQMIEQGFDKLDQLIDAGH